MKKLIVIAAVALFGCTKEPMPTTTKPMTKVESSHRDSTLYRGDGVWWVPQGGRPAIGPGAGRGH